jgi:ABC-type antimicrobial peptide transport system permease subunit
MTSALRRRVPELRPDARVRRVQPLGVLVTRQMVRERVLATLSVFFAGVALVLAGIGLYGTVNGAVLRQRREIGIRLALGASRVHIVRRVVGRVGAAATTGCLAGLAVGIAAGRLVQTLLFGVTSTDPPAMIFPAIALGAAAVIAAMPPVVRAMRTNLVGALKE